MRARPIPLSDICDVWACGLGSSSNDPCSMAELKEVAYLDAIGWIVHDSGL